MKFKGTVLLVATFIGIVLYYFLIDIPAEKLKTEEKNRSEKVLPFKLEYVKKISIIKKETTISLKRSGKDEWEMTKPLQAKGDSAEVTTFLSFLNNLNFVRVVEALPKDLSIFGLDVPYLKVILSMKNGVTMGLRVGDNHPMGNKVYLARLNEKQVLTASISKSSLDRKAYDLRDKTILSFKTPQIKKLKLIRSGKTLALEKKGESWQLLDGEITAKGDKRKIEKLLKTIRTAHIEQFIEQHKDQTSLEFKNPQITLILTESETNTPLTLLVGEKSEQGFYAKTLAKKNAFIINQSLFDTLNKSQLIDFMDTSLVDFNNDDLSKLTLYSDNVLVDLIHDKKDPQKWTIAKPTNIKANTATINSLLFDLKGARIIDFLKTNSKNSQGSGLEIPRKKITITYKNGKTWSLVVGDITSKKNHYFAKRIEEDVVFTLQKTTVEKIFRSLHDLKDRALFEFKNDLVQEIQIRNNKKTFILNKSKNKWTLTLPKSSNSIESFIGEDILWTLSSIEFESSLLIDPGNAVTGMAEPQSSIKLLGQNGALLAHAMIGNFVPKSPELQYLKVVNNPSAVYTIKKRFLDDILSNITRSKNNN